MPKKPIPKYATKHDDPEQSERFITTGKALGADKDAGALGRAFKKIPPRKPAKARP